MLRESRLTDAGFRPRRVKRVLMEVSLVLVFGGGQQELQIQSFQWSGGLLVGPLVNSGIRSRQRVYFGSTGNTWLLLVQINR